MIKYFTLMSLILFSASYVFADEDLRKTILQLEKRVQQLENSSSNSDSQQLSVEDYQNKAIDQGQKSKSPLTQYANDQSVTSEQMQQALKELEKYKQLRMESQKELEGLLNED